jgi:microcystin-dependent protein
MKQIYLGLLACSFVQLAGAQLGIGTNTPNSKALLDLHSSTRALMLPRMTTATKTAFTTGMGATHKGMMLFDSSTNQIQIWDGAAWRGFTYTGTAPVNVNPATNTVALNPGTGVGDLLSWNGANWINISSNAFVKPNALNLQPSLSMNYCIALQGIFPSQNGNSPFIGEVVLYAFNFPPKGWAQCNGQLLPINQNQALFSLLGTTYGGNGTTSFALPDLRGRAAIHKGQGPGLNNRDLGEKAGTEVVPAN